MTRKKVSILVLVMVVQVLTGCQATNNREHISGEQEAKLLKENVNQSIALEVAEEVEKIDEVTEAVSVSVDDKVLVAFRVKQFDRFHLKSIEKKVKKKVQNDFPEYKPTVSSDLKIFLETTKLNKRLSEKDFTGRKAKKAFSKIKKLSEEQT